MEENRKRYRSRRRKKMSLKSTLAKYAKPAVMLGILVFVVLFIINFPESRQTVPSHELPLFVNENYITVNKYTRPGVKLEGIRGVVFHPSGSEDDTVTQIRDSFIAAASEGRHESSHLIVGSNGAVTCCVPLDEVAYGSVSRNTDTISVVYCGRSGELPAGAAYDSLLALSKWFKKEYSIETTDMMSADELKLSSMGMTDDRISDIWDAFREEVDR